jgi:predicted DNA-binding protein (UPF0251 family)
LDVINLAHDELESLHLCDGEGKTQEEAGACMGVSRGTVQRLLTSARGKVAQALVEQKALAIKASLLEGNESTAPGESSVKDQPDTARGIYL